MIQDTIGRFVWHDLMTTDAEKAKPFYRELFGWKIIPQRMGPFEYPMIHLGETPIGGIIQEGLPEGVPSHWMSYVRVEDLDACLKRVTDNGGAICVPATDIPGTGRFAVITDPQGAAISPIQLDDPKPSPENSTPGMFVWDELHSKNPAESKTFYSAVFGWTWKEQDMGGMGTYHSVEGGERGWAGCMQLPPGIEAPANWMPYMLVSDMDASHTKAIELGASTYVPPTDIPGIGRFTVMADPVGAVFSLYMTVPANA